MAIQQELGDKGEQMAVNYLVEKGFEILATNYRAKRAEIDVICKESNTLVFVEVKTRTSIKFGNPEKFVNEAKATKIIEGAEHYIIENNWEGAIRFDIISIILKNSHVDIKHFKDAFY